MVRSLFTDQYDITGMLHIDFVKKSPVALLLLDSNVYSGILMKKICSKNLEWRKPQWEL
jgi:hypothetical protein